jgi:hypothetical protein
VSKTLFPDAAALAATTLGREIHKMNAKEKAPVFHSAETFDENRIGAAAVYCCDGRYGDHFDDFLHHALKLPRYDRLALPGGAACLAGHALAFREEESLVEQLRFLIKTHELDRVVLIAHQDCGFYVKKLRVSPSEIESHQREDMTAAVRRIHSFASNVTVDTFFARKHADGTIRFERMG